MEMAFLSIVSLNNYVDGLWDKLKVPTVYVDGHSHTLDKDLLIKEICVECSDLGLVYPNGDKMREMIGLWSDSEQGIWEKMYKTVLIDYNPLWNVDATITEDNTGNSSGNVNTDSTESVKGYNSNTWAEHTKDDTGSDSSGEWSEKRSLRRTGNIGVTSSQELLERERSVSQFNIYKYIVSSFKRRFCLMVY